jgi:tetratricopeptide (TPR) repeat protein
MDKDISEIAKLTERIAKDPKSKLFVPLAEEYKKAGDVEMSIHVLTEGLKNNPGYITARSFLGKLLYEKGDLSGAQTEFEEVVKAIPDNLMAQRKLGDLYVLQDRPADALKHYKIVLSLNPRDQETALLVSDAEAGLDIKARLSGPKPLAHEEAPKKRELSQAVPAPAAAKPQPSPAAVKPSEPVPAAMDAEEVEEPEEVHVVEPLEPADSISLEHALSAKNLDFLAETVEEPSLPPTGEENGDILFEHHEPFAVQQMSGEAEGIIETAPREDELQAAIVDEPDKKADDFTTDTLAELYITQGFFEKAVDIYERMLVDNPNSQGLKNKLAKVKSMAAEAAPAVEPKGEAKPFTVPGDFVTGSEPVEMSAADAAPGIIIDEYMPPAQEIEQPRPDDDWSSPATPPVRTEKAPSSTPAARQPKHFEVGFEPVEYVSPDAVSRQSADEPIGKAAVENTEKNISSLRKSPAAGRKETIARLENWLQNIAKEK